MSPVPTARLRLVKAHAYGNDFLLAVDGLPETTDEPALARRLCDRHRGIGADGVMVLERRAGTVETRLWNADGSPSELSGNGVRCVAAWLSVEVGLEPGAAVTVGTDAGPKRLELLEVNGARRTFRAAMGAPTEPRLERLAVSGTEIEAVVLRVGNPQCVVLGPATPERLDTVARALASHPFFPDGTNVELAEVTAPDRVRILIWERGVGPTSASGTGACAAGVAAAAFGGAGRTLTVEAPGGSQVVEWTAEEVWLTGWAELVGAVEWWGR